VRLPQLNQRGDIERVTRGVYRLTRSASGQAIVQRD
jgi:predicted transcriptional regulator of viral defense system